MIKKRTLYLSVLFCVLSFAHVHCGNPSPKSVSKESFDPTIVMGRYLFTSSRTVEMVGVYIPMPGEKNHHGESYQQFVELMNRGDLELHLIQEKHSVGYPQFDLVEIYQGDINVNRKLLENGIAFFNEDHWNKRDKNEYLAIEKKAREAKRGVWSNPESLEVLFIRPKKGRFIHYPDCHHVRELKEKDRVEYYVPVPRTPFMAARNAYFCDHCRPRFDAAMEKLENLLKVRLQS